MDEKANCGRAVVVDDTGVRLNGRGNISPSNPPTECIIFLKSAYANDDGSNKLQVEVESLLIKDCNVNLQLFNGRVSVGRTLQTMSCQYSSAGIFYSTNREVTVKLTRPDQLVHNEYQFTLLIKPFKDRDIPGRQSGVSSLSVAAIIGIILGCLVLVFLIILFCWCLCTGRLGDFNIPGRSVIMGIGGMDKGTMAHEKSNAEMMKEKDPIVWNSHKDAIPTLPVPRLYQRNIPRNQMNRRFEPEQNADFNNRQGVYGNESRQSRSSRHNYEPYVIETAENQKSERKETLIDDVFESDSASKCSNKTDGTDVHDDETLQKRSLKEIRGSPKSQHGTKAEVPETENMRGESPQLEKLTSIDLQNGPDQDTIASPHHVNAGIRASIEDLDSFPQKAERKSPKTKRKGRRDPDALPPEAFEPIFTSPITGIDYKSNSNQAHGYPGYAPYGLIPAAMFAQGVPGTQTYAYAYQTVPPGGMPGQQGAWVVQNMPTAEGNRRTAYVMEETADPSRGKGRRQRSTSGSRPNKNLVALPNKRNDKYPQHDGSEPDLSMVMRGAAPPDPGQGHRSVAMKSGTDPLSGIHTTQVVWTDTAPDPSDPKPGENPQVTRKTVTRVTTKSGHGELTPSSDPLMLLDGGDEPAFLSPSKRPRPENQQQSFLQAPPMPSAYTPDKENIDFYTGPVHDSGDSRYRSRNHNHSVPPPERTSTPEIAIHQHPSYNSAIRDRIPFDDSTV
ncbi:hypothetical protein PoB_001738400 [Plakobranchus ocellatus]|uniref:CUB domain-containing protein n=1 Tax=Plakobranchus ocellatus TaxID=259542 RepID=A0AAV3ZAB1_9GAST|nr:hypothetical protein PoB_001738400 [Plakobranchus ocellatus]